MPSAAPSRRDVLRTAAAAASAALLGVPPGLADPDAGLAPSTRPQPDQPAPWLPREPEASVVVEVRSEEVFHSSVIDSAVLEQMILGGVQTLTGRHGPQAWRELLGDAQRILIKCNQVGAGVLATSDAMARALVTSLQEADFAPDSIALLEAPPHVSRDYKLRRPADGWGEAIAVGDGLQPLAAHWLEADAVINVPFLKTHVIAGMSCALKNISHAVVRHPARLHANGCAPFVRQIIAHPLVSSRLAVSIVNALRIVVDRGPDARLEDVVPGGGLLFARDPVALDTVAHEWLLLERRRAGHNAPLPVPYLVDAVEAGLGRGRAAEIVRLQEEI